MKSAKSKTISFRVPIETAQAIEDRCETTKQSVGEYARATVLNSLYEQEKAVLTDALADINESVDEVQQLLETQRAALKRIAFALLTRQEPMDKETALSVISQIFRTDH